MESSCRPAREDGSEEGWPMKGWREGKRWARGRIMLVGWHIGMVDDGEGTRCRRACGNRSRCRSLRTGRHCVWLALGSGVKSNQAKTETKAAPFIEELARPRPAAEGFYIARRRLRCGFGSVVCAPQPLIKVGQTPLSSGCKF